jgi:hypothetical protein
MILIEGIMFFIVLPVVLIAVGSLMLCLALKVISWIYGS